MSALYAAMRDALVVTDAGGSEPAIALEGHDLECVAAHPDAPDRVFCGTFGAGLHRSTDGGATWDRVGEDTIASDAVMAVAIDPRTPDTVWAGTEPSAIYRSVDGGATWDRRPGLTELPSADRWSFPPRPETHHVRWIEPDPHRAGRLYVGIEAGALVITDDGGATWRDRPPGSRRDNHHLATHPDDPGRVYAAAGDGYAESEDGGETWHHPQEGLDRRYVWSVAVAPDDPDTVLVSAASGAYAAHSLPAETYVYRRRAGDGWTRLDGRGLPTGDGVLRAVLAPGRADGTVYAVNNHGLYRSPDAGGSWSDLGIAWPDRFAERTARGLAVA